MIMYLSNYLYYLSKGYYFFTLRMGVSYTWQILTCPNLRADKTVCGLPWQWRDSPLGGGGLLIGRQLVLTLPPPQLTRPRSDTTMETNNDHDVDYWRFHGPLRIQCHPPPHPPPLWTSSLLHPWETETENQPNHHSESHPQPPEKLNPPPHTTVKHCPAPRPLPETLTWGLTGLDHISGQWPVTTTPPQGRLTHLELGMLGQGLYHDHDSMY